MSKASGSIDLKSLKVAGDGANKYITEIDGDGIKVHAENNVNANYTVINAKGMEVFQGTTSANSISIAKFGVTTRIGTEEDAHLLMTDRSITGTGLSGKDFFVFEDSATQLMTDKTYPAVADRPLYDFPYTGGSVNPVSFTLPETPDAQVRLCYQIMHNKNLWVSDYIVFTVGTSETKAKTIAQYSNYGTLIATYNGTTSFSDIKLYSHYTDDTDITFIRLFVTYKVSDYAPAYMIGSDHTVSGGYSLAEGYGNTVSGNYSHAEGYENTASSSYTHVEGKNTTASNTYAHAEGESTTASAQKTHAEGEHTTASGLAAHAEGTYSTASALYSHAEGDHAAASGVSSHAEGYHTKASAKHSHAQNEYTEAVARSQTVIGTYNVLDSTDSTTHPTDDTEYGKYALIIGNGRGSAYKSNALTVAWNGKVETAGGVEADGNITAWGDLIASGDVSVTGCYDSLYKITSFQHSINGGINANSYVSADTISIPSASRVDGYNLVGIVGHSSNYFRVQPTTNYVTSNTSIYAGFANWSATNVTANVTVTFWLLWLRATEG